ncbi:MAG: hypothetical protein QOE43_1926 [Gaiellaceae bacterium]|nr:hypothetical protein [Gaiellaceae bacterium]
MKRLLVMTLLVLVAAASASAATLPGFRSPSGNISCLFIPSGGSKAPAAMLCKLAHADYAQTLQARCHGLDWHGFLLPAARKGAVNCSGGILYNPSTQHPSYITLAYGKTWLQKMFSCTSKLNGVNCSNPSGHGMFISRQTWRTW